MRNKPANRQKGTLGLKMRVIIGVSVFAAAALLLLIVFNLGQVKESHAFVSGDFRSAATGDWNDTGAWEIFDGTSWKESDSAPGEKESRIVISNSHTVTLSEEITISTVIIEEGAQLNLETNEIHLKKENGKGGIICNGKINLNESILSGDGDFITGPEAIVMIGSEDGIDKKALTGNIQTKGKKDLNKDALYIFSGSVRQRTGNGLPAALRNLTFDNRYGVDLDQSFVVTDKLSLYKGVVHTGKFSLTVGISPATTGIIEQVGGTVSGKIRRWFGASNHMSILFPVSDGYTGNLFSFSSEIRRYQKGLVEMNFHPGMLDESKRSPFDARQFIVGISSNGYYSAVLSNGPEEAWLKITSALTGENANKISWKVTEKNHATSAGKITSIQNLICGPNPFKENFIVHFYSGTRNKTTIQVMNQAGQQVHSEMMEVKEGYNQYAYNDGPDLAPGVYIIRISNPSEIHTLKIVKE